MCESAAAAAAAAVNPFCTSCNELARASLCRPSNGNKLISFLSNAALPQYVKLLVFIIDHLSVVMLV